MTGGRCQPGPWGVGRVMLSPGKTMWPGQQGLGRGGGYILPCQACVTSHPTSLGFLGCLRTQAKAAGLGAAREAEAHSPDPWTLLILVLVFICFSFPK